MNTTTKQNYFEALKAQLMKAAGSVFAFVKKAAIKTRNAAAVMLAAVGRSSVFVARNAMNVFNSAVSMASLGATVAIQYATLGVMYAAHATYKIVFGMGLTLVTPLIAINYGSDGVSTAWNGYFHTWTKAGWKTTGPVATVVYEGGNVHDIFTGRVIA